MKGIQITIDEQLLMELDESEEAKRDGRSAVLRRALREYLRRRRRRSVAEQYHRAYAGSNELGVELEGWEEEGEWPLD
jgi:metal-responsive CopG/Arc/MetJ family transcriptional regulator